MYSVHKLASDVFDSDSYANFLALVLAQNAIWFSWESSDLVPILGLYMKSAKIEIFRAINLNFLKCLRKVLEKYVSLML